MTWRLENPAILLPDSKYQGTNRGQESAVLSSVHEAEVAGNSHKDYRASMGPIFYDFRNS